MYVGMEGDTAPPSLTSAPDGGELSATRSCRFTSGEIFTGTHYIRGWVGPRTGVDTEEKRKFSCSFRELNPDFSARSPSLYRLNYRGSIRS
jgi:hypothetical protein